MSGTVLGVWGYSNGAKNLYPHGSESFIRTDNRQCDWVKYTVFEGVLSTMRNKIEREVGKCRRQGLHVEVG